MRSTAAFDNVWWSRREPNRRQYSSERTTRWANRSRTAASRSADGGPNGGPGGSKGRAGTPAPNRLDVATLIGVDAVRRRKRCRNHMLVAAGSTMWQRRGRATGRHRETIEKDPRTHGRPAMP